VIVAVVLKGTHLGEILARIAHDGSRDRATLTA